MANGKLTDKELEIASLRVSGLTMRAIAEQLKLSLKTVDSHLTAISHKLGTRNRKQLSTLTVRELKGYGNS